MKTLLLSGLLILSFGNPANAIPTLIKTFNSRGTYLPAHCSPHNLSCSRVSCSNHQPNDAPEECYQNGYVDIIDMVQYQADKQAMQKYYEERISALENLLRSYRDQIKDGHRDVAETLISDPQFRRTLYKKIKDENR